jgi:transglutaminase-like putative cysteine protease
MVRLQTFTQLAYEVYAPGGDFVFSIEAARTRCQSIVSESLQLSQQQPAHAYTDPATGTRTFRVQAEPGPLTVRYDAVLDLAHHRADPAGLAETALHDLPGEVLPYLYPSRYCPSDRLLNFAGQQFGQLAPGYGRARAIRDWVNQHVTFRSNSSDSTTWALDTLVDRVGVCRDFAHLMVALCRAVNLPARVASGMDFGANPLLGPTDFHAYVEVYLQGGWYLFDPSGTAIPMGFVRFATGRDAADIAFATIFGNVRALQPLVGIEAVPNGEGRLVMPEHVEHALSTDGC